MITYGIIPKLKKLRDALNSVSNKVYHYAASDDTEEDYIVWYELSESETDLEYADNRRKLQSLVFTVNFYTKKEYNLMVDIIQDALDDAYISYALEEVAYDKDTKIITYTWSVEIE